MPWTRRHEAAAREGCCDPCAAIRRRPRGGGHTSAGSTPSDRAMTRGSTSSEVTTSGASRASLRPAAPAGAGWRLGVVAVIAEINRQDGQLMCLLCHEAERGGRCLPRGGNTGPRRCGSGHLAVPWWRTDTEPGQRCPRSGDEFGGKPAWAGWMHVRARASPRSWEGL